MPELTSIDPDDVTVLGWVIPRPTGRWHQSIIITAMHVLITPELSFANNQVLVAATEQGREPLYEFLRSTGWSAQPQRCELQAVRAVDWNNMTGMMRIAGTEDHVIGAMIPNRSTGDALEPQLKHAIAARRATKPDHT